MAPLDIVYVVKIGDDNEELRYSLRSVAVNLPHARVWIVGYAPRWVNRSHVNVIEVPWNRDRFASSTANLRAFLEHPRAPLNAVLMNDDFFIMEPIGSVPILNRGPVLTVAATSGAGGDYAAGMRRTVAVLAGLGLASPLSYELHMPMIVNVPIMREILRQHGSVRGIHKRTLYGNLAHLGGVTVEDCKVRSAKDVLPRYTARAPFLSTNDHSFRHGVAGAHIRGRFPDASPYELRPTNREESDRMAEVTYENVVTGRLVTREESAAMDLSRRWRRVTIEAYALTENGPENGAEAPSEALPEPDGRASREKWAAYAESIGVSVDDDATKADIREGLKDLEE